jgi:sec-independent protein translocase protein TatB
MFNIGAGELVVILLIALIVLGPQRLPDAAKQVGRVMGDLRRISSGFQQELKDALDTDDSPTPLRRKESAPLAASVADADAATTATGTAGGSAPPFGRSATSAGAAGTGTRDQTTVAPAVAAALDEVVAPVDAPSGSDVATSASDRATTPRSGDDPGQAGGPDGGAGLGDERAAS